MHANPCKNLADHGFHDRLRKLARWGARTLFWGPFPAVDGRLTLNFSLFVTMSFCAYAHESQVQMKGCSRGLITLVLKIGSTESGSLDNHPPKAERYRQSYLINPVNQLYVRTLLVCRRVLPPVQEAF